MNAYDRTGEPIEPEEDEPPEVVEEPVHDPRCVFGWIDQDGDVAVPCTFCKPWLAPDAIHRRLYGVDPGPKEQQ